MQAWGRAIVRIRISALALSLGCLQPLAWAACPPHTCCITPGTPGAPSCEKAAGNPINVTSGNKFQREVDLPALPGVLGLEIVRYYNSDAAFADEHGIFGRGWRLSYDEQLVVNDGGASLTLYLGDGTHKRYLRKTIQPGLDVRVYEAVLPGDLPLRAVRSRTGTEYRVTLGGNDHVFNDQRKLVSILAPTGEAVILRRDDAGLLVRVTDPQGRSLELGYLGAKEAASGARYRGVQTIDSPVGRFSYTYGSAPPDGRADPDRKYMANLVKVALPSHFEPSAGPAKLGAVDGITTSRVSRIYHYEDVRSAGLLTGISVLGQGSDGRQMDERLVTWAYDRHGRGVLSVKGRYDPAKPGIEQVTLKYVQATAQGGVTVLTNSLGQETTYSYVQVRGEPQVTQVRGAGCASCGPVNVQYRYDSQGRLTHEIDLDSRGEPLAAQWTEYDAGGRPLRMGVTAYAKGKPGESRWQVRYGYGNDPGDPQPVLIARPSVVAGKEHTVRVETNPRGQPVAIHEDGFSPLDANGTPSPTGSPIHRTTRFTYTEINQRSVLVSIDGPLPNGPKNSPEDSDITRIEWDAKGNFAKAVESPMGLRKSLSHDPQTGFVTQMTDEAGVVTLYGYGRPQLARPDSVQHIGQALHFEFDALGQLTGMGDGTARSIRIAHDAGGHLNSVSDAQGYSARWTLDTEGMARLSALHEPNQAGPLRATYRWFDELRRPVRQLRPDGRLDTWAYADDGALQEHIDGESVRRIDLGSNQVGLHLDLSPDGWVRATVGELRSGGNAEGGTLRDDFGRAVRVLLPGQGVHVYAYAADDLPIDMRIVDKQGQFAGNVHYDYDVGGRWVRRTANDPLGKTVAVARRDYRGALLVVEDGDTQAIAYTHDAQGRIAQTDVAFKDEQGAIVHRVRIGKTYDSRTGEAGTLLLADGRHLRITRDATTGAAVRVGLESGLWGWLRQRLPVVVQAWVPQKTVVEEVRLHPFNGITAFTFGNRLQTVKTFDIAGRLLSIKAGDVLEQRLTYGVGPRIRREQDLTPGTGFEATHVYTGFGSLRQASAPLLKTALTAATQQDGRGRYTSDGQLRYAYTLDGQVDTVRTPDGTLLARYRYNAAHQRTSKTVYGSKGEPRTTYFLWQDGHVAAEIEGSGAHAGDVSAQYLYLADARNAAPIAKLESSHAPGNQSGHARTLFIHSNHRAEPVAMTDGQQHVVWRARSDMNGYVAPQDLHALGAVLNLRLPGQYHDSETGLHDNWHRSYDPRPSSPLRGRYLSPDPLGHPDGPDPYLYAQGDPVNRADPTGLYQIDVHYYLTFFLALAAGVEKEDARIIALAAQYIDVNEMTRPLKQGTAWKDYVDSVVINQPALVRYHFTQDGYDPPRSRTEELNLLWTGKDLPSYIARRVLSPSNPQLDRLMNASDKAPGRCAKLQLFGEYLHAFEDTFAHRNETNDPFAATVLGLGLGHARAGEHPDYTYNHEAWQNNYSRTMEMEKEVFEKMSSWSSSRAPEFSWGEIEKTLAKFTAFNGTETFQLRDKLNILREALVSMGFDAEALGKFSPTDASNNRLDFLLALKPEDYVGVILPQGTAPIPK